MNKTVARRVIKAAAMQNMRGNWLSAFAITLIQTLLAMLILGFFPLRIPLEQELINAAGNPLMVLSLFLPQVITAKTITLMVVTVILYLLVMCPFSVGVGRFFLKIARGEKARFSDVFSVFTNIRTVFASVLLNILITLLGVFWSVFALLMPMLALAAGFFIKSAFLIFVGTLFLFVAMVFCGLWVSRYNFAIYIFADRGQGAFAALRDCIRLLSGRNGEILLLRASYFGWDIASTYIPALSFVYRALSGTVYAKYIYYLTGQLSIGETETPPEV